jgi:hypothetical protein
LPGALAAAQNALGIGVGPRQDRRELRPGDDFGQLGEQCRRADQGQRAGTDLLDQRVRRCVPEQAGYSTLVSMTARTPPPFGTRCLYLRIDLFHRHRRYARGVDTGRNPAPAPYQQREAIRRGGQNLCV